MVDDVPTTVRGWQEALYTLECLALIAAQLYATFAGLRSLLGLV